ncbi:porin family protein [Limibacter armeniacum]|uniref:porin family protein n=1 Tax=Limibacter armeniacum TaxID=466084 RepID=UPI002FE56B74
MKKLFFTLIAIVGLTSISLAQNVTFGVKAGANFSNITNLEMDTKIGFVAGGVASFQLSDAVAIQPEVLFSAQGAKTKEGDITAKTAFNYINIPVMAKFYLAEGFNLQVGPQLGILASAKAKVEGDGADVDVDLKDSVNSIDFGLNLGAAYELESGLYFEGRYNLGLTDTAKDNESDDTYKNSVFSIGVGYFFGK